MFAESLFDSVIYVTFQELATRVSHRNTGKACNETVADQLLQRVSADENLHMIFYRDVSEAGFDIAPNQAMDSLHRVLRNFKMPGYTVPEFRRKAVIIAVGGVYDPRIHLDDVVMPVLKKWRIFEREDFTGEAAEMRDDLGKLVEGARGDLREVRGRQGAPARARAQGRREEGGQEPLGHVISVLTEPRSGAMSRLREEQTALRIGPIALRSPVVLAPMAGVTNVAFRTLCRELELARAGTVSGLYVCEMVTARALVERHPVTMHMTTFAPDESPRSLQLYTVDPDTTFAAAKMIADEGLADHIDMNFGCPVPKVTRRGGGAALPFKRRLFGQIVAAAVRATEGTDIPVTVKFRIGIDDAHHTHLDAGRIAAEEGAAAVALHARTAAQRYSGTADWEQIALLKQHVTTVPVLGNGDIFDADDAMAMMAATGCDGVVIGRGCLGRPWLFAELSAAFTGTTPATPPTLGEVAAIMRRHGQLLATHFGEDKGMRDMRKHIAWYLHGFPAGADLRRALALVKTLDELETLLDQLDPQVPFPTGRDRPAGPAGVAGVRDTAGGLAGRSRGLHGARGGGRYELRRLNRDVLGTVCGLAVSQDVSVRYESCRIWLQWRSPQSAATRTRGRQRHCVCRCAPTRTMVKSRRPVGT